MSSNETNASITTTRAILRFTDARVHPAVQNVCVDRRYEDG